MSTRPPVWVYRLTRRFWDEIGEPFVFPRDLRQFACWLLDLKVQEVRGLTLTGATYHFRRAGIPCPEPLGDRPLCGCFGSTKDQGHILLDTNDTPDQIRFTFAHELAHFLRDFREPRRAALAALGSGVRDALDGKRPATVDEQLAGALHGITFGAHAHFLERDRWGRVIGEQTHEAEAAADRLAFELLAPFDAVNPDLCPSRAALVARLVSVFGLPPEPAAKYAALLNR